MSSAGIPGNTFGYRIRMPLGCSVVFGRLILEPYHVDHMLHRVLGKLAISVIASV